MHQHKVSCWRALKKKAPDGCYYPRDERLANEWEVMREFVEGGVECVLVQYLLQMVAQEIATEKTSAIEGRHEKYQQRDVCVCVNTKPRRKVGEAGYKQWNY
jgi:hypothetical protein